LHIFKYSAILGFNSLIQATNNTQQEFKMIYSTVNEYQFINSFKNEAGDLKDFSYDGLSALFEYLDNDEDYGSDVELDIIAIRCEFAEYSTATAAAMDCGWTGCTLDTNQQEAQALEWLEQQTTVITFNNGLIIQRF
jgi:hypothetical protein